MLTWREVYNEEIERQVKLLRDAQARGQTRYVDDGREFNPLRMSDTQVRKLALLIAERTTNTAINVEIEGARKRGRPADLN